jgi:hypothetical protein
MGLMMARLKGERFVITLCAIAHPVPAILRVRALLKRALRDYRLRCVSVTEAPVSGRAADAQDGEVLGVLNGDDQ